MNGVLNRLSSAYGRIAERSRLFGLKGALGIREFEKAQRRGEAPKKPIVEIRPPGSRKPLWMRLDSSDPWVVEQVFVKKEYGPLNQLSNVRTIIDCGANVGYTSAFLLDHHPQARVLAIEPVNANAEICKRNLAQYGQRAEVLEAAVWDSHESVEICPPQPGWPQSDWGMQMRSATDPVSGKVPSVLVPDLIERVGGSVDILKIDIEGAEERVFSKPAPWLDAVRALAIELHGEGCRRALSKALEGRNFRATDTGDLTIYWNPAFPRN